MLAKTLFSMLARLFNSVLLDANNSGGPILSFGGSRSTTVGTPGTIVSSGDHLGDIRFAGDDPYKMAASIRLIGTLAQTTCQEGLFSAPQRTGATLTAMSAERMRIILTYLAI